MKVGWSLGQQGDRISLVLCDGEEYTTLILTKESAKTLLRVLAALIEEPKEMK